MAGEVLKQKREALGIDIQEASDVLKISSEYLSAIENDNFDKLPVAVYTIGYVRCYAKYLDVDAEPVVADFVTHLSSPKPSTIIPVSSSKRKVPGYLYIIVILLAGLTAFLVYTYTEKNGTVSMTVDHNRLPEREKRPVTVVPPLTQPPPERVPTDDIPLNSSVTATGQAPVDTKEHRLGITARDTVWVRIRFEKGSSEEMLLRPGVSKSWDFNGPASLKIGNAGGVMLQFDGRDLGVPGKTGQVVDLIFPSGQ